VATVDTGSRLSLNAHFAPPEGLKQLTPVAKEKCNKWIAPVAKPQPIFPLERPVLIKDSALIVSARLCDSLRLRSVKVEFNDSQALCKTSCNLTYSIDLYQGPDGGTQLVIERLRGCSFTFRHERESAINAAKGLGGVTKTKFPRVLKIPDHMLKEFKGPSENELIDTINRSTDQLHSTKRDVKLFTLQNLSSMTAPNKVHQQSAQMLSKLILESKGDIRDIIAVIMNACMNEIDDISCQILNACLTIFSNTMTLMSESKKLEGILNDGAEHFAASMVPSLIHIVKSRRCPHVKCVALRCLCLLLNNSSAARDKVDGETRFIVEEAESFGKERHLRLEQEAQSTLSALRC
jgi:hypothetical protein